MKQESAEIAFYENGESVCVNALTGDGIEELFSKLVKFARETSWYEEEIHSQVRIRYIRYMLSALF